MLLCSTHADRGLSVTIDITQNSIDEKRTPNG